jgi:galactokinase
VEVRVLSSPQMKSIDLFVPGRVCLFGEHSDWAGEYRLQNKDIKKGYTIIVGANQGIYSRVSYHPTNLQITTTNNIGKKTVHPPILADEKNLLSLATKNSYLSYIAGVTYYLKKDYPIHGLLLNNYKTDLAIKKGLSSSAAICVTTARAFNLVYNLKMSIQDEMEYAYKGEILTGSKCGRMDQGCAYGNRPILMTFAPNSLSINQIYPKTSLYYVIADLNSQKNTKLILEKLNACYPTIKDNISLGVQKLLGPINIKLIKKAKFAIESGDTVQLGKLMTEAQTNFDKLALLLVPKNLPHPNFTR